MADKKPEKGNGTAKSRPKGIIGLPIQLVYPEGLTGRYANHLLVQVGQREANLSFFEIRLPPLVGSAEEVQAQAKKLKGIQAEAVARLIVPLDLLPEIITALQETWDSYQTANQASDGQAEED
jgi:hypothetical protein